MTLFTENCRNKMKPILSIIILSFNTKDILQDCLNSIERVRGEIDFEVVVVDNGSDDGSELMVKKEFRWVTKVLQSGANLGFSRGNNLAKGSVEGKYVLFLNSDTKVLKNTLLACVKFMENDNKIGALTCKVILPDGKLDKDTRRSFITPWIGLTHLYLKLDRFFPRSELFAKYWYGYKDENTIHEIDSMQGAFLMTKKDILDKVGWFDEDYFLDGEDIDLCWKIKELGYKNIYFPEVSIIHLRGASKGKNKQFKHVSLREKLKYRLAGVNSMEIFVRKRLWSRYPKPFLYFVLLGINLLKIIRAGKTILLG